MTSPNYRLDIDGVRAVAVLAVIPHHLSAPLMPGGYVGADVFFVISGYLIARIISREMEEDTFTFARSYERRARHIFTALFVQSKDVAVRFCSTFTSWRLLADALLTASLAPLIFSQNLLKSSSSKKAV